MSFNFTYISYCFIESYFAMWKCGMDSGRSFGRTKFYSHVALFSFCPF